MGGFGVGGTHLKDARGTFLLQKQNVLFVEISESNSMKGNSWQSTYQRY